MSHQWNSLFSDTNRSCDLLWSLITWPTIFFSNNVEEFTNKSLFAYRFIGRFHLSYTITLFISITDYSTHSWYWVVCIFDWLYVLNSIYNLHNHEIVNCVGSCFCFYQISNYSLIPYWLPLIVHGSYLPSVHSVWWTNFTIHTIQRRPFL